MRVAAALKHTKALLTLLGAVGSAKDGKYTPWQFTALAGLLDALDQRGLTLAKLRDQDPELKDAIGKLGDLFKAARSTSPTANTPEDRHQAMLLLGRADR